MTATSLPTGQIVFDPRGAVEATRQSLAPRLQSLAGVRLGVLDNSKWNAGRLLRRTVALLEEEAGPFEEVRFYKKHSFSSNAAPPLLDRMVSEVDAVVTAVGD
jgi:hypothetical protein